MACKQKFAFQCPFIVSCGCSDEAEDCGCGQDNGCGCGEHGSADQAILEKILERLTQIQECVCDCGGGVNPEPGYTGEAIGVILPESGRKSGTALYRVDKDIENVDSVTADYFNKHPLWSGIVPEEIDGQAMIKVPAFAYKRGVAASGSNEGKKYLLLAPADTTEPGFERHPAFMKDGQPVEHFWIGVYEACVDPTDVNKIGSVSGTMPLVSTSLVNFIAKAKNRNTGNISGFMLQSVYQRAAIQMLYLMEYADTDSQKILGNGNSNGALAKVNASSVVTSNYRGILGLWGNAWELVDGIRGDVNKKVEIWKRDGSTSYVSTFFTPPTGSAIYMTSMENSSGAGYDLNDMFIADQVSSASVDSKYSDGYWGPVAGWCGLVGGSYAKVATNGMFTSCFNSGGATATWKDTGSRIAKI